MPESEDSGFFVVMNIDSGRQYRQDELPGDVFNVSNGDIRNFNGRAVKVQLNPNGTRSLQDLGSFGQYQAGQDQQRLTEQTRVRENEFLGRVRGIPEAMRGLETELELPQAREAYQGAGQTLRGAQQVLRDLPGAITETGRAASVNQNRLTRAIAKQSGDFQPTLETATRGVEEAQAGLSGLLGAFQTRAENVLAPYQIEAGILGDSVKNEFDLYKTNVKNNLDRELATLQENGLNDRAALDRASKLAELERAASQGSFQDLGNRVVLVDPSTGREIQSFSKGKLSTLGGNGKAYNPAGI